MSCRVESRDELTIGRAMHAAGVCNRTKWAEARRNPPITYCMHRAFQPKMLAFLPSCKLRAPLRGLLSSEERKFPGLSHCSILPGAMTINKLSSMDWSLFLLVLVRGSLLVPSWAGLLTLMLVWP